MSLLEQFITSGVFAFMLIFVRFGTAFLIMPGIGDTYVPQNIRLHIALAICLVLTPVVMPYIPVPLPPFSVLLPMIVVEFITGLFIGTIARVLMMSLDTAGMLISMSSGISNGQIFNPTLATQGSIFGAFLTLLAVTLLFVTNLHHLLIQGLVESYHMFPVGHMPDTGSMAQLMTKAVAASFKIGFQIALPFVLISMVLYILMGVLTRLMPQLQVFMIVVPGQILLALITLALVLSGSMLFFLTQYENGMIYFLSQGEK